MKSRFDRLRPRSLAAVIVITCVSLSAHSADATDATDATDRVNVWGSGHGALGRDDRLLSADSAFQLVAARRDGDAVRIEWVIAPGYYLYRKRFAFEPVAPAEARLGTALLPQGLTHHDDEFGDVEIYREMLEATLPVARARTPLLRLRVRYQGCADTGVCYPPVSKVVDVTQP